MGYDKLILILVMIIAVSTIICIIKKVTKIVIVALIMLFIFSIFKAFSSGMSPLEVFNSSKNDATYSKEIYNYTEKVKKSVENTVNAIGKKSMPEIIDENKNLHSYLDKISKLQHGVELNAFHDKYYSYLKNIVSTSDALVKGSNVSNGILKNSEEVKSNLKKYVNALINLKVENSN